MQESSFLNPMRTLKAAGVHERMHVADFGAGSGFFTRAAAHLIGRGGSVWAVDAHRPLLARLKALAALEGMHNVELAAGDLERRQGSHLPSNSMDVVIAANILFSAEDKDALIEEIWRVLKKNGKALVIDWKDSFGGIGPHRTHVFTEAEARKRFERGGLLYVKDIPAGAYHWGFLAQKKNS